MAKMIRCPRCKKETLYDESNPSRPFCSERCQTLDLGAWADEAFKIPAQEEPLLSAELEEESPPRHKLQ